MLNLNQNINVSKAVKMLDIKEIGTYPTPIGEVNMFYENDKVVVNHYDACGEHQFRVVYDSLDEARIGTADWYY